jgi:hypothetical protein
MPSLFVRRTGVRVPQEVMPEEERADVIEDAEFVELDGSFSPSPSGGPPALTRPAAFPHLQDALPPLRRWKRPVHPQGLDCH